MFMTMVAKDLAIIGEIDPAVDPETGPRLDENAEFVASLNTSSGPMKVKRIPCLRSGGRIGVLTPTSFWPTEFCSCLRSATLTLLSKIELNRSSFGSAELEVGASIATNWSSFTVNCIASVTSLSFLMEGHRNLIPRLPTRSCREACLLGLPLCFMPSLSQNPLACVAFEKSDLKL